MRNLGLDEAESASDPAVAALAESIRESVEAVSGIDFWEDDPADYIGSVVPFSGLDSTPTLGVFTGDGWATVSLGGQGRSSGLTREQWSEYAQLVGLLEERWDDSTLSQAPAPTFAAEPLAFGETPLLEPCRVFTADAFTEAFGLRQTPTIRRESYPRGLAGTAPESAVIATCRRGYVAAALPSALELSAAEEELHETARLQIETRLRTFGDAQGADDTWESFVEQAAGEETEVGGARYVISDEGRSAVRIENTIAEFTVSAGRGTEDAVTPEKVQRLAESIAVAMQADLDAIEQARDR